MPTTEKRTVIIALENHVRLAQQAVNSARDRSVLGDQNYLEVLITLRRLQDTDLSLIAERLRLATLWVGLAEATGQPLSLNLECCDS